MNDYKTIDKQQWTCLNKEGDAGSGLIYINSEEPDVILKTSRRAAHGLPMFDLGHFYLYCHYFAKQERVNNIAHMSEEQIRQFWNRFAFHYNGPDGLDLFEAQCKRYAGLALIMIGYLQVLTDHEREYLGKLATYLLQ